MPSSARQGQRGFSLVESLIAAAIAAGVIAAAAQSIAVSVRLNRATAERAALLNEADTIAARLRAGLDDDAALAGFDRWTIERAPYAESRRSDEAYFDLVTVASARDADFSFALLAPSAARRRS
ncbi:MAG: prepilin-type N-terminal cleavage/methylation domain-containing protein [Amphiplicatus sp.]